MTLISHGLGAAIIALLAVSPVAVVAQQSADPDRFVVTVLGSGSPILNPERLGPSTLVEAGEHRLLFDAGRGAIVRLSQAGVSPASVSDVFFTHYHSDHLAGFPDFWLTSWIPGGGGRSEPLGVTGPVGLADFVSGLLQGYAADIKIRIDDQKLPPAGAELKVTEFETGGVVFDQDGVLVTAFEVDHGEKIKPAFGYKIEFQGKSVVITGDTMKSDAVIEMATGADLLIHPVAAAPEELAQRPPIQLILGHHPSPADAGEVFAAAGPKLAAYNHLVLLQRPGTGVVTPEQLIEMTRRTYDGPLVVSEDLMQFTIADTVTVGHAGRE